MTTACTVSGVIVAGDAVCVTGWDAGPPSQPIAGRATAANLATSKTVFGIAETFSGGGTVVHVRASGEAFDAGFFPGGSPMLSGTGAGSSHIVATDITQGSGANQCKLVRVERPNGSEHVVGTCDENGNIIVQPRASRDTSPQHVYNVCAYGAFPNWDGVAATNNGMENLAAFNGALAAMKADGFKNAVLVADGWFFIAGTLDVQTSIVFEGSGRGEPAGGGNIRSWPGTWLVFPENTTGIRLNAGIPGNPPAVPDIGGADGSVIRNMTLSTIHPADGVPVGMSGHGIWMNCLATLDHVEVQVFGEHGIYVHSALEGEEPVGNPGGFQLLQCATTGNGYDGIHIAGVGANVGLISCCLSAVNAGWGFYDRTLGNTYVGCHGETNFGGNEDGNFYERSFKCVGLSDNLNQSTNSSVYFNCYTDVPAYNEIYYPAMVFGGDLGNADVNQGIDVLQNRAFALAGGGSVEGRPLRFTNTTTDPVAELQVGQQEKAGDGPVGGVLNFVVVARDSNVIRYDATNGWWGLDNVGTISFRFPTTVASPRRKGLLFEHGIFYGAPSALTDAGASKAITNHIAMEDIPAVGTWEKGDVVWNTGPTPGGSMGWVCTTAGTNGTLVGVSGTVDDADPKELVVNTVPDNLTQWAYITIAAGDVHQVVNDPGHSVGGLTVMLDSDDVLDAVGAVAFSPAVFKTFGTIAA